MEIQGGYSPSIRRLFQVMTGDWTFPIFLDFPHHIHVIAHHCKITFNAVS